MTDPNETIADLIGRSSLGTAGARKLRERTSVKAAQQIVDRAAERTPPISVRTLGEFRVFRGGQPIPATEWQSKKARDLFKILVTHRGQPATREQLVSLLWPDDPSDRTANRLSVLLSRLRTVLAPDRAEPDTGPILADRHTVTLDLAMVELDVDAFLTAAATAQAADRCDEPDAHGLLATAEAAYTGDFLPDDPYYEWAEELRETARCTHIALLRTLIRRTTDLDQREHQLRRLLAHDPYDEPTHHALIGTLTAAGRHSEALRRYRDYAARMAEIGVTPAPFQPVTATRSRSVGGQWTGGRRYRHLVADRLRDGHCRSH
jgi:DNA-binding SARP family transcriptional activator